METNVENAESNVSKTELKPVKFRHLVSACPEPNQILNKERLQELNPVLSRYRMWPTFAERLWYGAVTDWTSLVSEVRYTSNRISEKAHAPGSEHWLYCNGRYFDKKWNSVWLLLPKPVMHFLKTALTNPVTSLEFVPQANLEHVYLLRARGAFSSTVYLTVVELSAEHEKMLLLNGEFSS